MKTETTSTADSGIHSEAFLRDLMRRQFRLSAACASAFVLGLFGLPLLNYYAPDLMAQRVAGFTLSWLLLGVLFLPLVWAIAWVFIRRSIALEREEASAGLAAERALSQQNNAKSNR